MLKRIPVVLLAGALSLATLPVLSSIASAQEPPSAPNPSDSAKSGSMSSGSGSMMSSKSMKKKSSMKKKHKKM